MTCISHYPDGSPSEQVRMREILMKTLEDFSENEDSPTHGFGTAEEALAINSASTAFECFMRLFEYDKHENLSVAMREAVKECSSDEEMQETESEKHRRYQQTCTMGCMEAWKKSKSQMMG